MSHGLYFLFKGLRMFFMILISILSLTLDRYSTFDLNLLGCCQ